MKKWIISLGLIYGLSACAPQTTTMLRPGEVMGTKIGTIVSAEAGLDLSSPNVTKMNSEIDKALYFSDNGLTTRWYAGYNVRFRPLSDYRDRRDRECRKFRHGHMIDGEWQNATGVACRERDIAWYLIANRWDKESRKDRRDYFDDRDGDGYDRDFDRDDDFGFEDGPRGRGGWQNLGGELSGNVPRASNDDFGPRDSW